MANSKQKKSKNKIIIFSVLGILLIAVILVVVLNGNKEKIVFVQAQKAQKRTITQTVSASGTINPIEQVILRPEVSGEIVKLPVDEGQVVKKGQLLIQIKPNIYIAQKKRAKAILESAQAQLKVRKATLDQVTSEYKRVKSLYAKGLASTAQLEQAKSSFLQNQGLYQAQKSAVLQTEESLKEAEGNLAKTEINAPFDGTISLLNVKLHERVLGSSFSQGTQLMTVANLHHMEATVDVDENDVVLVAVGDTSKISIDAFGDKKFLGIVTKIGNSAITTGFGTQNQVVNFEVKIKLLQLKKGIRPGMSCDTDIQTDTKYNVVSVPIQSVTARTTKQLWLGKKLNVKDKKIGRRKLNGNKPEDVVFLVDSNKAKMVPVTTGISNDNYIEIKKGLKVGDMVITGPYRAISKELGKKGTKISVQKKKNGNFAANAND